VVEKLPEQQGVIRSSNNNYENTNPHLLDRGVFVLYSAQQARSL
jgi:hypothetical protein